MSSVVPETEKAADYLRACERVSASGGDQTGPAAHVFAVCSGPGRHGGRRASTGQEGEFTHLSVASAHRKSFDLTPHARARAYTHKQSWVFGPDRFRD